MFCGNCGKQIPDDAAFCTHCGAKQEAESSGEPVHHVDLPPSQKQEYYSTSSNSSMMNHDSEVDLLSMGQYLIMFLITAVPIVGIVMLFIWGFGSQSGPNKKNFARAYLIMMGIAIVLSILLSGIIGAIVASMMSSMYYY